MAGTKTLAFDRVRVIAGPDGNGDGGSVGASGRRRAPALRHALLGRPWRDSRIERSAWVAASARLTASASSDASPSASGDGSHAAAHGPNDGGVTDVAHEPSVEAAARTLSLPRPAAAPATAVDGGSADRLSVEPAMPPPLTAPAPASALALALASSSTSATARAAGNDDRSGWADESEGSVAAIVRAVEEASLVRNLAALLVETCGGEAWRDTGPWTLSLALPHLGGDGSRLELHLSSAVLSLRFECNGPGAVDLLCRQRGALLAMLRQDLPAQLEIEIAIVGA